MKLILIAVFLAFANAQNRKDYGCDFASLGTLTEDVVVESRPQGNPLNVDHFVQVKVSQLTKDWSMTICFDTPQCVTAAWIVHSYQVVGEGVYCTRFVSTRSYMVQPGGLVTFRFQTSAPVGTPGPVGTQVSTVRFDANGVFEDTVTVAAAPSDVDAFCTACDGGYAADLTRCDVYHHCSNGKSYVMPCPSGLYWDSSLQTCNSPGQAGCHAKSFMGTRRIQCSGALNNCPALADGISIHGVTYHISACTHDDTPTTPAPAPGR